LSTRARKISVLRRCFLARALRALPVVGRRLQLRALVFFANYHDVVAQHVVPALRQQGAKGRHHTGPFLRQDTQTGPAAARGRAPHREPGRAPGQRGGARAGTRLLADTTWRTVLVLNSRASATRSETSGDSFGAASAPATTARFREP